MVRKTAIIEDEKVLRESVAAMLSSAGYGSEKFESAEQFIEAIGSGAKFGLWIIDIDLPGMRGDEMIVELAQRNNVERTKVCILSGLEEDEIRDARIKIEAFFPVVDCLSKPVQAEAFIRRIESCIVGPMPESQAG